MNTKLVTKFHSKEIVLDKQIMVGKNMSNESILGEYFFNPWAIPYFLAAFFSLVLVLILIRKAEKNPSVRLFTGAQICNFIVGLTAALASSLYEGQSELWGLLMIINAAVSPLTVTFFFHFSYSYLNDNKLLPDNKIISLILVIGYLSPFFEFIIRTLYYFPNIHHYPNIDVAVSTHGLYSVEYVGLGTLIYLWGYFIVAFYLILAAINFVKMYRSADTNLKNISGYFILAVAISVVAITIGLLLYFMEIYLKFEIVLVSTVLTNLIIGYGILKKELFNINEILRTRIVPYALTNFFLTWILILTKESINHIFAETFFGGIEELSMGLMILIFIPVHDLMHKVTQKLLPASSDQTMDRH